MDIYINELQWHIQEAMDGGIDLASQTIWLNTGKSREAIDHDIIALLTQAYAYSYNHQGENEVAQVSWFISAHFDAINAQREKILENVT